MKQISNLKPVKQSITKIAAHHFAFRFCLILSILGRGCESVNSSERNQKNTNQEGLDEKVEIKIFNLLAI